MYSLTPVLYSVPYLALPQVGDNISVAELPLFWAAPAPGGQGPGADSGSDLLGSAPAPG